MKGTDMTLMTIPNLLLFFFFLVERKRVGFSIRVDPDSDKETYSKVKKNKRNKCFSFHLLWPPVFFNYFLSEQLERTKTNRHIFSTPIILQSCVTDNTFDKTKLLLNAVLISTFWMHRAYCDISYDASSCLKHTPDVSFTVKPVLSGHPRGML